MNNSDTNEDFAIEIAKEIKRLEQYVAYLLSEIELTSQEITYIKKQLKEFSQKYLNELSNLFNQFSFDETVKFNESNDNNYDVNIAYIQSDYLKPLYKSLLKQLHPDVNKNANLNLINILNHAYRHSDINTLIKLEQVLLDNNLELNNYAYMTYLDDIYMYYTVILSKIKRTKDNMLASDDYKLYIKYFFGNKPTNLIHEIHHNMFGDIDLNLSVKFETIES